MAQSIDNRIVEARFNNSQFERNISQTMKSLDLFDKKLKLENSAKGLKNLERSAASLDLSSLSKSVDFIANKFTFMGRLGVNAFDRISNAAITAGKNLVKSLTINPMKTGFDEYELKMGAIQTLMAGTGESLERVNLKLNELNQYSDQTIYAFSDMTSNIGKFTNAGVSLDDSVVAMKGIANWAARSGASASDASRAMYNLGQALGTGKVLVRDWMSIENANMATMEFKETVIGLAKEMGTIEKGTEVTGENFREMLEKGFFTNDVLMRALNMYGDETTDIGKKASQAATEVKTLKMLVDTLTESVQSGWAQSWELIVGDYDEAKQLFTQISDVFGGILGRSAEARNKLLKEWKDAGGRDSLINAIRNIYNSIYSISRTMENAWKSIFPPKSGNQLANFTKAFEKGAINFLYWLNGVNNGTTRLQQIRKIFVGVFSVFDMGLKIVSHITGAIGKFFSSFGPTAADGALTILQNVGQTLYDLNKDFEASEFFQTLKTSIESIFTTIGATLPTIWGHLTKFYETIKNVFNTDKDGKKTKGFFSTLITSFTNLFNKVVAALPGAVKTITDFFVKIATKVRDSEFLQKAIGVFNNFINATPGIVTGLINFVSGLYTWFTTSEEVQSRIARFGDFFAPMIEKIKAFKDSLKQALRDLLDPAGLRKGDSLWTILKDTFASPEGATEFINRVVDKVKATWETLKQKIVEIFTGKKGVAGSPTKIPGAIGMVASAFTSDISGYANGMLKPGANGEVPGPLGGVLGFLESVWGWLKKNWGWLVGGLLAVGIVKVALNISSIGKSLATIGKALTGSKLAETKRERFRSIAQSMLMMAGAVAIVVGAIYAITQMDQTKIGTAIKIVGGITAVLFVLSALGNIPGLGKSDKVGIGMGAMAAGVFLIVQSIKSMAEMLEPADAWKTLEPAMWIIGGILLAMVLMSQGLRGTKFDGNWKTIIAMAASVWIIVQALKPLKDLDKAQLQKMGAGLIAIGAMMALLVFVSKAGKNQKVNGLKGFMRFALGIWILIGALRPLADMDYGSLGKMGLVLGAVTAAFYVMGKAVKRLPKSAATGGVALMAGMAGMIFVLGDALNKIKGVSWGQILAFTGGITLVIGAMTTMSFILSKQKNGWSTAIQSLISLVGIVGILYTFADAMNKIKDVDVETMLAFAGGVSAVFLAYGGFLALAGVGGVKGLGAGLGAIAGLVAVLLGSTYLIGALMDDPKTAEVMNGGVAFVAALVETLTAAYEEGKLTGTANGLEAMANAQIDQSGLDNTILAMEKLRDFADTFQSANKLSAFALDMSKLGEGMTEFTNQIRLSEIDAGVIEKTKQAIQIAELLTPLTKKINEGLGGSLNDMTLGQQILFKIGSPMDQFRDDIANFGLAMSSIVTTLDGITIPKGENGEDLVNEKVTSLVGIANSLNEFIRGENIPEREKDWGRHILSWLGTPMDQFRDDVQNFALAMWDYTLTINKTSFPKDIEDKTGVAIRLATAINSFVASEGMPERKNFGQQIQSWFSTPMDEVRENMTKFALAISLYKIGMDAVPDADVLTALEKKTSLAVLMAKQINQIYDMVPNVGYYTTNGLGHTQFVQMTEDSFTKGDLLKNYLTTFASGVSEVVNTARTLNLQQSDIKLIEDSVALVESIKGRLDVLTGTTYATYASGAEGAMDRLNSLEVPDIWSGTGFKVIGAPEKKNQNAVTETLEFIQKVATQLNTAAKSISSESLGKSEDMAMTLESLVASISKVTAIKPEDVDINAMYGVAVAFLEKFKEGLSDETAKSNIATELKKLTEYAADVLDANNGGFYTSGVNMIQGLANGMSDSSWITNAAAKQVMKEAMQAARDAQGEQSPAKKLIPSGVNFVGGLAKGMVESVKVTNKAATTVVTSAQKTIDKIPNAIGYIANAMVSDVGGGSIPKPDAKGTSKGADAINAALAKNSTNTVDGILGGVAANVVEQVNGALGGLGDLSVDAGTQESLLQFAKDQGWWKNVPDWLKPSEDKKDDGKVGTGRGGKGKGISTPQVWQRVNTMQTVGKARTQIDQIELLADRVAALGNSINGMKVVMDSGALVGQIQAPIDRQLGMNALYSGRR